MLPQIKDDAHYETLWEDDDLWDVAVRELLVALRIPFKTASRMSGGSNIIYVLDEARVFKLFAPLYLDDAKVEEASLDAALRADLGLPVPAVLERGEVEGWRWLLMTRLVGENPIESTGFGWLPELELGDRIELIGQLADWMRASWESRVFESVELPARWTDWETVQTGLRDDLVAKHRDRGASPAWLAQIEPFFEDWEPLQATRVIHADLHGRNLLVSKHTGRWEISGVLDFADTLHAPPIYDLAAPTAYLIKGERELAATFYERCLGKDHGLTAKRVMQWILLHRFSDLSFYVERLPHVSGRCTTLDEMARLMTGLD